MLFVEPLMYQMKHINILLPFITITLRIQQDSHAPDEGAGNRLLRRCLPQLPSQLKAESRVLSVRLGERE